jgi:hypothetical protein
MKLRCTVIFEYTVDPDDYGEVNQEDILAIDTEKFKDEPFEMAEVLEGASKYTVTVEAVKE